MTVRELIARLQQFDGELPVVVEAGDGPYREFEPRHVDQFDVPFGGTGAPRRAVVLDVPRRWDA